MILMAHYLPFSGMVGVYIALAFDLDVNFAAGVIGRTVYRDSLILLVFMFPS
jgi:hypothetical protein